MYEWHKRIQMAVDMIDEQLRKEGDDLITLHEFAGRMGYSPFHATRKFKQLSGMSFREYLFARKLAFALVEVRDSGKTFLQIALDYGFSSHEAFTRAFRAAYGVTPKQYRQNPAPVVLRTKLGVFDRYLLGIGEIGMAVSTKEFKVYYVQIPAHQYLHIKNYDSDGYFDFWEKMDAYPGQDCDTICGLLDSIKGKLDGDDGEVGFYSGQLMARLYEEGGKSPEAYGIRLPSSYAGPTPDSMLMIQIPEGEYIVFEHGPFDYEKDSGSVFEGLEKAIGEYSYEGTDFIPDHSPGRISYYYHDARRYMKKLFPVRRR